MKLSQQRNGESIKKVSFKDFLGSGLFHLWLFSVRKAEAVFRGALKSKRHKQKCFERELCGLWISSSILCV